MVPLLDVKITVQHNNATAQAGEDRLEERIQLAQLATPFPGLLVDGLELLIGRLELLVHGLQLFVGGLELFVGGFQLLDRGLQLLVGGLQLFVGGLQLLQGRLQLLVGTLHLLLEAMRSGHIGEDAVATQKRPSMSGTGTTSRSKYSDCPAGPRQSPPKGDGPAFGIGLLDGGPKLQRPVGKLQVLQRPAHVAGSQTEEGPQLPVDLHHLPALVDQELRNRARYRAMRCAAARIAVPGSIYAGAADLAHPLARVAFAL